MRFNSFRILRSKEETPTETFKESVEKLAKDLEKKIESGEVKDDEKEEKEEKEEKKEKKEEKKEEGPSKEEVEKALALVAALNDPDQREEVVAMLAKKVGLTKDSTKEEKKVVQKSLKDLFKEKLGEDYSFLADNLFDAVKDVIASEVEEKTKDIRTKVTVREEKERETALESGYAKVEAEFSNFKDIENDLVSLMDEMPPKPGQDPATYFRRLAILAASEKNIELKKTTKSTKEKVVDIEKARRNANDVSSRLTSERDEDVSKDTPPQIRSVKDAVAQAAREVEKQFAK